MERRKDLISTTAAQAAKRTENRKKTKGNKIDGGKM